MTDSEATPQPITRNRPTNYPDQIVIMATEEQGKAIRATAADEGVSISVIGRRWLDAGRAAEMPSFDELAHGND